MEKIMTNTAMQSASNSDKLQQAQRTQLIARLRKTDHITGGVIGRRGAGQPAPLSYSQERLWIMSELEPDNPIYNVAGAVQFDGLLNTQALQQGLDEVVRRHEILRSRFVAEGQQVLSGGGLPLTRLDLAGFRQDRAMELFQRCADDFNRQPFRLAGQPPLRALLVILGERKHILLLALHHIVSDRWSVGVLMQEVAALYRAYGDGQSSALPELPIQYGDFCVWQRGRQQKWAKDLDYWRQKLAGAPPLLELPTDRPRPPVPSYRGEMYSFELSAELSREVIELGKQYNATLFMVMAAAFNTLLYRYTGSKELCIGYPVAGRSQTQTAALIGFFVNTLVLRCRSEADLPFSELLLQLREQALQDQNHQELSFGQLLDALNPVRNTSHAPLFQVMLAVQNVPMADFRMQDVSAMPLAINTHTAQFDLTLFVDQRDGKLLGGFEYNTDLFDAATIQRMAGHLQMLLAGVVSKPELPLKQLPLMTQAETKRLLEDWSGVGRAVQAFKAMPISERPTAIHQLFEIQAQTMPDKTALAFAGRRISYGELNSRAQRWAERLMDLGIGAECRVGVCAERSVELIVGLLATLKAGAAYVPLDPSYPEERLDYMLDNAGIELLLTQSALVDKFKHRGINMLYLDQALVEGQTTRTASRPVSPNNTAYIIYTSGSTGQPKGVPVSHRNLLHSTLVRTDYYREPLECFLLLSSFAFDSSVAGIFWTLSQGGCLCLPQQEDLTDPSALAELIDRHRVSHLLALPSFYTAIINDGNIPHLNSLRAVIVAGEACSGETAAEHHRKLPAVQLYNEYGPTEGTVWSSVYRSEKTDADTMLPIGRAIAGVRIYILDEQCQPAPIGISGELCIGGAGLAQGYLNQPALTAEKFIPNPFSADGERLYKTGDLARFRADGEIEFLGRIDNQVKIRGYRIELGEIEARLLQHPAIAAAAVLATEDNPGNKRLTAYIVPSSEPETQDLQRYLGQALPDFMVPSLFISLDKLPLTPNGKLDHKRLPQPDLSGLSASHYEEPQTPVERALAGIWSELLAVKRVGRHDNFFELGGDSILSIQAVSRARQAGIVITPKLLFQHQTVAALAMAAGHSRQIPAEQGVVSGDVALTPIQHWFFEQNLSNPHHWNQALFLEIKPGLTPDILDSAIKQLLIHHDVLRTRFTQENGEWKQYILNDETQVAVEHIDLSGVAAERQAATLESAASVQQARLHLSGGPVLRAVWFDLGPGQSSRVLIAIHHLVVDGVSWRILLEDLAAVCLQLMSGQTPVLPAKTTSFKYWSEQIVKQAGKGGLPIDNAYWLDSRRNRVAVLPVDEPAGRNLVAMEDEVTLALTAAETRTLLQDVPGAYRTKIDEMMLNALTRTLCDWMRCESVLIDMEGHGREDIANELDVSRTVGWFTAVYPALLTVAGDSSSADMLKSVKEQLRAVPMNGIGYGLLRYASEDAEALALQPKAQVIFNYLGQLDTVMAADAPFVPTRAATGQSCDPAGVRPHELAIVGSISDGQMQLSWRYSGERYRKATIETLAGNYRQYLKALIAHCVLPDSGGYTPSDFPLIALPQSELDAMALKPRQIEDVYPLAPLQYGLVFHSLYAPESGVYCIQLGCRLSGELNVPAFKQAWQLLADRHSILRSSFQVKNQDQLLQIVHKHVQLPITEYDWRRYSAQEQALRWQQLLADDQANGFDFARAPLMRLALVQCSDKTHYFVWSYHHVLLDGWSAPLLIKDVFSAYHALRRGDAPSFPSVQPYSGYIAWLQKQDMGAAEAYWRSALGGFTAPTPLIIDKTPDHAADSHAKEGLALSASLSQALQAFAKHHQLTLNTLVQGAWGLLLSRYSGENDVVFGATVSGRPADMADIESMVGLFINSLPVRVKVTADSTALVWLQALFAQNQDMHRFEYAPLTHIQGWSDVPRGASLFESLLVFENYPIDQALTGNLDGLTIDEVSVVDQTSYPLTVSVFPGTELLLEISYAAGRFEAETIKRMLGHLQGLLEVFIEQPQTRLSELPFLNAAEQQQILLDWNATEVAYPKDRYIHQLIEAQAEATPDAPAVAFEGQALTYAELNGKANRLAHYLLKQGVGPDVLVGVCVERSLEMVIGLLGILKAGGAYLPLDPSYPQDRLEFMLSDVAPPVILTQAALSAKQDFGAAAVFRLDSDWAQLAQESAANPDIKLMPENLAYCIYTSGSTGQPKGAGVPHQGILNRLQWMQAEYALDQNDRVLQKTPYSFDVSVWEFFWPLMTGAQLVVAKPDQHKDSRALIDTIVREQITTVHFVPSMLQAFIDTPGAENCTGLKRVICSGEALPADLVARFQQKLPAGLHNLYGPTEASVDVSYWACVPDRAETAIPIGRPIANIALYILDRRLNPVPVGTPGELHIGGIGLGRGYLNRPGLTAEKFIPNPFGSSGSRLYKTGDLVRYRPDGDIDYLGRIDHQVKIRGFRIELGEIEARLLEAPDIKEAVVIAREDQPGDKRLVAYLVAGAAVASELLKLRLKETLPEYMVPSAFVQLDGMPLSANGKLDRKRLPRPDLSELSAKQYVAPRTAGEEILAEIWADVLGVDRVGVEDNFFELGGHSLLATQLVSRICIRFGIDLPLKTLFDTTNVAQLAAKVDLLTWARDQAETAANADEIELEDIEL